jgi:acyl carrier protein/GNAT superfamily N-acetyltransferase
MGGTYAHICISEAETVDAQGAVYPLPGFVLPLSARHPAALRESVAATVRLLETLDPASILRTCRVAAIRRTHHEYRIAFAALSAAALIASMKSWVERSTSPTKASAKRKLLVLVPEGDKCVEYSEMLSAYGACSPNSDEQESGRSQFLLRLLRRWGIPAAEVLRYVNGRIVRRSSPGSAVAEEEVALQDLKGLRADFLDLTCERFLSRVDRPAANGNVLFGFTESESVLLTPMRLLTEFYALGYPVSWSQIYPGTVGQVSLPTYPWQHQKCWLDLRNSGIAPVPQREIPKNRPALPSNGSLKSVLSRLSGIPADQIRPDSSPADLGIDSLLTLELQDELRRMSGVVVPVEELVQVSSVAELESLLQQLDSVPAKSTRSESAGIVTSKRAIEIQEASLDDYEKIAAVILDSGLGVKAREEWEHVWTGDPVLKKHPDWPIGWVVRNNGKIVGFLGNIPLSYCFNGREILAAGLHAFALEPSHRGLGLLLLNRLLEFAPQVEYFVGSSANPNSSAVLDRIGVSRIPVGDWENSSFWITNYDGFVSSAISKKGLPDSLASAGSVALQIYNKVAKTAWPRQKHELQRQTVIDERFDSFWEELKLTYSDRFLAKRSRECMQWHFKYSLAQNRTWIVTYESNSRVLAYGIFQRQDYREIKLQRVRLVDYQELPGTDGVLPSILAWGLSEARKEGIHMLEAFGFREDKQKIIDRLAPHRRKLNAWGYFHKIVSPSLERELQDLNAWDPSLYDGDSSL